MVFTETPELRGDGGSQRPEVYQSVECVIEVDEESGRFFARVGEEVLPAEGYDDYNLSGTVVVTSPDGERKVIFPFLF